MHGPFDPCLKIIKLLAEYFAVPLAHIFNQSFQTMKFPEVWKISNVCAIPKITPCNRVEKLRPNDLKTFYCCVIRSTLEYGAQLWNGNLTQAQRIMILKEYRNEL